MEQTSFSSFEGARPDSGSADVERWATLAAAATAMAYGFSRRSIAGTCLAFAAAPFAFRGLTGQWPQFPSGLRSSGDTREALAGDRGIHVRESVRVAKPVDEVYRFWRQVDNFPCFMSYLEEVTDLGGRRSHWVAKGPAETRVEWDAEIINEVENKVIGWRSLPG